MNCKLSRNQIESFCGDILPLRLLSDTDIKNADIVWSSTSDAVMIRDFSKETEFAFNNGILITLMHEGSAVVKATLDGNDYCCTVTVNKRRTVETNKKLNYYIGDFHDHTSKDHNHDSFAVRETELPIDYIKQVKEENKIDFGVITDHADVINPKDFYRGFTDTEECEPMDLIMFPGSESEVTVIEQDRYGLNRKNAGEIVYVNTATFSAATSWQQFYDALELSPFGVLVLAHPQVMGWDKNGIWNFSLHKNNAPKFKELLRGVEIGNGGLRGTNVLHELYYSVALDNGFKVSVTCSSDSHGPLWGYNCMPGKTIIMAPEKSKEMFLDALLNRRFYACESGNVKLYYTVNGYSAAKTLPLTNKYNFHIECSYFNEDATTIPIKCQIVSDGGKVIKTVENVDFSSVDFEIESNSASYFYLRLIDSEGRKTVSAPVWTGRKTTPTTPLSFEPIDKTDFTATDLCDGADASMLLNDNPEDIWTSGGTTAKILIDMKKEYCVCALGHYPARYLLKVLMAQGIEISDKAKEFPVEYKISTSTDGVNFKECASGIIRIFGSETIIDFEPHKARYVRFDVLSTTGKYSERKIYEDAKVSISELTVFTK